MQERAYMAACYGLDAQRWVVEERVETARPRSVPGESGRTTVDDGGRDAASATSVRGLAAAASTSCVEGYNA